MALVGLAGMLGGCFPCPACVTADIDGVVIDEVSKEPVSGAAISATEYPEVNALSDEEGRFYLGHKTDLVWVFIIGDRYTVTDIRIEKEGYRTKSVEVFGWPACGPEEVTVELEPRDGDAHAEMALTTAATMGESRSIANVGTGANKLSRTGGTG